jgi:hypothetical protein
MAGTEYLAQRAYQLLRETEGEDAFRAQIEAVQTRWLEQHEDLAGQIPGRKILLWLSSIAPPAEPDLTRSPVGAFPHFVTARMFDAVVNMGFEPVICVLAKMPPQILVNDRTGRVQDVFDTSRFPDRPDWARAVNTYYATPELHDLAVRQLLPVLLRE